MSFLSKVFSPVFSLADRVICVVMAIILAQGPIYTNQYLNVLSGALKEATINYNEIKEKAKENSLSVPAYIDRHVNSTEEIFRDTGEVLEKSVKRYDRYNEAFTAISASNVFMRPVNLITHFDPKLNEAVQFEPGVPVTMEGLGYAVIGILFGLLLIGLLKVIGRFIGRRLKGEPKPKKTQSNAVKSESSTSTPKNTEPTAKPK